VVKKRLIFTLLVDNGNFQLSRNFSLQKVGDINWLFNSYHAEAILHSVDELVVLNVSKEDSSFDAYIDVLQKIAEKCFMPIAAGGGIRNREQIKQIFYAGADKIVLNSALFLDKSLVEDIAKTYGRQNIVGSLDYRIINEQAFFYIKGGQQKVDMPFEAVFEYLSNLEIGELYLTSIDQDGTGRGYDVAMLKKIQNYLNIPLIASGGVGKFEHLYEGALLEKVTGVSTAHLFNFIGNGLQRARAYLREAGIPMAQWDYEDLKSEMV